MTTDILYLAFNRLEFTEITFELLLANTTWPLVETLYIYDDGSEDGTREYLEGWLGDLPVDHVWRETNYRSPVAIMNDYVGRASADLFAKVDSDIAMPPGWLEQSLEIFDLYPEVELLGLAAGWSMVKAGPPNWQPASHIGGVGLMKRSAFTSRQPPEAEGRQGFTTWQHKWEPRRGWIQPDILAVQLDLIPEEPFVSLAASYVEKGWARYWPPMEDERLWEWVLG